MRKASIARWLKATAVLLGLLLLAGISLHPYLAVTAPVDGTAVAVEGWMPEALIPEVVREIEERGYEHVYTTGTTRPFSYHLYTSDRLVVRWDTPVSGELSLKVAGLNEAAYLLLADGDTLLSNTVAPRSEWAFVSLKHVHYLEVVPQYAELQPSGSPVVFIKYMLLNGKNVHTTTQTCGIVHTDGSYTPGTITHADHCAHLLQREGIPQERITVVRGSELSKSRTMANAEGFAIQAGADGLQAVNIISLGVHARRSRKMFRKACDPGMSIGIIALHDPEASSNNWFKHRMGWLRVMKELGGLPASSFFDAQGSEREE